MAAKSLPIRTRDRAHTSSTSAEPLQGSTVEIRVDRTFTAPGDQRALGMVLLGVGFVP